MVIERAMGIGGISFRAKDPERLTAWYAEHLGLINEDEPGQQWWQQAGYTVWAGFDEDPEYFGRRDQLWMINFKVPDLDAMLEQLRPANGQATGGPGWQDRGARAIHENVMKTSLLQAQQPGFNAMTQTIDNRYTAMTEQRTIEFAQPGFIGIGLGVPALVQCSKLVLARVQNQTRPSEPEHSSLAK